MAVFLLEDLDASMSSLQWVVDSYNIAVAGLVGRVRSPAADGVHFVKSH